MKILITGATGFVGSHCVREAVDAGHDVRLLVRAPQKLEGIYGPHGIELGDVVEGDMEDGTSVKRALEGCEGVIHAAATFYGGDEVLTSNVAGVRNVVGGAFDLGIDPIVYFSTIGCMFPGSGETLTVDAPIESFETMYGKSKAEGERITREYQAQGAPVTNLYPAGILGPFDPGPGELTKGVIGALGLVFPQTPGGLSLIDVRDLAHIAVRCLEPGRGPRRYMTAGHYLPWRGFADQIADATGRRVRRLPLPAPVVLAAGRLLDVVRRIVSFEYPLTHEAAQYMVHLKPCDSSAVLEELGIEFRPTPETIADTIRWLYEVGHIDRKRAGRLADD